MSRTEKFKFSHTRKIESAHRYVSTAHEAGVLMNRSEGANGRTIVVDGRSLLNFGSCSYMALESRPELCEAAHRAIDDYGTQFHFSRAYLECPLYVARGGAGSPDRASSRRGGKHDARPPGSLACPDPGRGHDLH